MTASTSHWEFWIDVGGTFTDCIARSPQDQLVTNKVLSSGLTKGCVDAISETSIECLSLQQDDGFWSGYEIRFLDQAGSPLASSRVVQFAGGSFGLADSLPDEVNIGTRFELDGHEEAPILAIRQTLGLMLSDSINDVSVKLGTTRGTNALLTREGARTAFITTKGFRDILLIGNQDRPRLFDLAIQKPEPLFGFVVEIEERIDTNGQVLQAPNEEAIRSSFVELQKTGVQSLAICLLHAFANGDHERIVERLAREVGFEEISTSSRLSPLIKIVSRGDTTVMDAYLNPILRDYVKRLRASLGDCDLKMMTSAGGLVDADTFVGKDSILSGPAGGVIGFSRVAQRAGFSKSIGFDMGGTSTDVSRFDGEYEMEFETQKAGVRIVAPMLAIETVAAGGGSVCGFDGVKLFVGPQSAGANPGPACYGRGGPLTVTDVNLFLGRILPQHFPFPLDTTIVESRLATLCAEIAVSPLGKKYSPIELAEGYRQIANANMVRAIRKISVAKGYDPSDFALVTFGGAAGQHACAMARSLGVKRILVHPFAGILSAYGIGLADVRRFAERSVLTILTPEKSAELDRIFVELEAQAIAQVRAENISTDQMRVPIRSLELRYRGAESTINISAPALTQIQSQGQPFDFHTAFEQQHQQLFGYTHAGRELEVVAARVEAVGEMDEPEEIAATLKHRIPEPSETCETWFDGQKLRTAVFDRNDLQPGDEIAGPAIVCEPTSTVVIEADCTARIIERGEIVVEVNEPTSNKNASSRRSQSADPVMLEIFNNLFASIAEQMGVTLQKTSFSTNVKERLDFSCAIFTPTGDLVVNAPHIPVHLGAMSETVKCLLNDQPSMQPGDVFVTNDPFRGGSHLPDVTVITPVHLDDELIFLTASRAHHAEIGGIVPGSMPPFSKRLSEEGVLIRNFQLVKNGASREDALRDLLSSGEYPSRSVDDNIADVSAQVAANNSGVRQLNELVTRYSLSVVHAYMSHIQQAANEKMRRALKAIPDGVYVREDALDDGSPIKATIDIHGDEASVDFTGTGAVLNSNLNANKAIVNAAVLYVFRCLIDEDIPLNSGVLDPVTISLPECLLNPPSRDDPKDCVAIVGGNVETSQRVVDVLLGALEVAAASQGTMNNLTFGDGTFGYYETICGGSGATKNSAGADAVHTHMTNTRLTDVEVIERRYPVRVHEFSIRRGSGGKGQNPGGDGIVRRIEFLKPLHVSLLSERRSDRGPFGLAGGGSGQTGRNMLQAAIDSETTLLLGKVQIEVDTGNVLTIETPGGGAYGPLS